MKPYSSILLRSIVALALVAVISLHPFGPAKGTSSTPVYVLGVSNPTDQLIIDLQSLTSSVTILTSVTSLTTLSPGSILYVDGSWLASASSLDPKVMPAIVQTVLTGLPTVVVRGDPSILPNAISGLMKYDNPGLPLIAEGVHVTGTLTGGIRQGALLRIISGFDYSIATEFRWATQQISQTSPLPILAPLSEEQTTRPTTVTQAPTGPYWLLLLQASTDTNDHFKPFGQVTTTFSLYQLQNSGSTVSKWFNIFSNQTMTPGIAAFSNSTYRNYLETTSAHPNNQTTNIFVSNGPASQVSSGPTTVTYSIGAFAGSSNATLTSTQTMSYFLKNTNVTNTSNPPNVGWVHTISGGTAAGKLTLQFIPGWTDKVAQDQSLTISGNIVATFATFGNSNTPTSTASNGVSFAIFSG